MICRNCGATNPDTMKFCGNCGSKLIPPLSNSSNNDNITSKKSSKKVLVVVLIAILFLGLIVGYILIKPDDNDNKNFVLKESKTWHIIDEEKTLYEVLEYDSTGFWSTKRELYPNDMDNYSCRTTEFEYDEFGYPIKGAESYSYDSTIIPFEIENMYDENGLLQQTHSTSWIQEQICKYDEDGNLLYFESIPIAEGPDRFVLEYTYDEKNLVVLQQKSTTYDINGEAINVVETKYSLEYIYNDDNQVEHIIANNENKTESIEYTFDEYENLISKETISNKNDYIEFVEYIYLEKNPK